MTDFQLKWNASYSSLFTGDNTDTSSSVDYTIKNADTGVVQSTSTGNAATWNGTKWQYTIASVPNISPSGALIEYEIDANLLNTLDSVTGSITGDYTVAYNPVTGGWDSGSGTFADPYIASDFGTFTINLSDDDGSGYIYMRFDVPAGQVNGSQFVEVSNDFGAGIDTVMYGDYDVSFDDTTVPPLFYCGDDIGGSLLSRLDSSDWGTHSTGTEFYIQLCEYDTGCGQGGFITSTGQLEITFGDELA